jgi:hypothetical protein
MSETTRVPTVTIPPTHSIIRSLRAPLFGYAATLIAAVVMTVLVIVAIVVDAGGFESDTGVNEEDTEGLWVWLGMPFQMVAMAIFGPLHFEADDFEVGVFALPLVLTAVFTVTTYLAARRTERTDPSPDPSARAFLAVTSGVGAAVVVSVVTRVMAMRADGATVHATSVGLFLGTIVLTSGAVYAGRAGGAAALLPRWFSREYRLAAQLWGQHLLLWVAILIPIAFVYALVEASVATAILIPLWGPTAGFFTYALGHLGGVTMFDATSMGWDIGTKTFIVLLLLALLLTVAASVTWLLRRNVHPEWLATPNSWLPLPAMFFVGGLVVWLVPTMRLSGGWSGASGSASLQPAPWFFLVLAAWGALIELGSRTVAPALATRMPEGLRDRLGKPARTAFANPVPSQPVTAPPREPMTPEQLRRAKRIGVVVGGLAAILGLSWLAITIINSAAYGPEEQAREYLDSIKDADIENALNLAPVDDEAETALLDNEVYAGSEARVKGYVIRDIKKDGDTATITVGLKGLEGSPEVELTLDKDGHTGVFFDKWRVVEGGLAQKISLTSPEESTSLGVNGAEVSVQAGADAEYWVFPGSYHFDPYIDNEWIVAASNEPTSVSPEEEFAYAELPEGEPSEEFTTEVNRQLALWLDECMKSRELEPDGCPQSAFAFGENPRKVKWTLTEQPTLSTEYFDGTFPAELSSDNPGEASVTYEADESYGFGAPDWVKSTETDTLYISAKVTESNGELTVEFSDY